MDERKDEGLKALGKVTDYKTDYDPSVLETFINKHPENDYWVRFNCPEFTSLCPITGQPDFAEIRIEYIPDIKMVESKSLKLYLFSFRNHGDFHEDCVNKIMKDLIHLMNPKYIEVSGFFTPRGGISIYPYANYGRPGTKYEELAEYQESKSMEELADLLEVMRAVAKARGSSMEEVEQIRREKAIKRGGFDKKLLLTEVQSEEKP